MRFLNLIIAVVVCILFAGGMMRSASWTFGTEAVPVVHSLNSPSATVESHVMSAGSLANTHTHTASPLVSCCKRKVRNLFWRNPGDWLRRSVVDKKYIRWMKRKGLKPKERRTGYKQDGYLRWLMCLANVSHPVSCIIDVGANVGDYIQEVVDIFRETEIYAFEAHPEIASALQRKWSSAAQVHIYNAAVSENTSWVTIYDLKANKTKGTAAGIGAGHGSFAIGTVQAYALDDFIATQKTSCNKHMIVKVDIEGFDYQAMLGMKKLLSNGVIDALQLEFNPRARCKILDGSFDGGDQAMAACLESEKSGSPKSLMMRFFKFLDSFDYQAYLIGPSFLPIDVEWRTAVIGTGDILALPIKSDWAQALHCNLTGCCQGCEGRVSRNACFSSQCDQ